MKKINKRRLKYGANNTVLVIGAVVIFILFNFLAAAFSEKFPSTRIDMTENGMFEIGEATKGVLAELDESGDDVTVYYMKSESDEFAQIKEIILKYLAASKKLKYEVKYYVKDPSFTKQFDEASSLREGSLIVNDETSGRYRIIRFEDMVDYTTTGTSQSQTPSTLVLESRLTNALAYCISKTDDMTVYFSMGHQEADPNAMAQVLLDENITPAQCDLTNAVPPDCRLLLIISPTKDFTAQEIENLDSYLDGGGSVQIAVEPTVSLPRLESYLAEWGVTLENNYVMEMDSRYGGAQYGIDMMYPQIASSASDIIESGARVIATLCRGVSVSDDPSREIKHNAIFYTTKNGIAYSVEELDDPDDEGTSGSYDLCVYLEKTVGENYDQTASMIVSGSSSFWGISNYEELNENLLSNVFAESSFGNKAFFVGSVYKMLGLSSTKLTISGKSLSTTNIVVLTDAQKNIYRIIFCYAMPIVIVLVGIVIWLRRRHL